MLRAARTDSPDPFYRRSIAEIEMGDFAAALPDLERVTAKDPKGRTGEWKPFENVLSLLTIAE